jgi:predicted transcriptional regulator of viral defense system
VPPALPTRATSPTSRTASASTTPNRLPLPQQLRHLDALLRRRRQRYAFTTEQAVEALGSSVAATRAALRRLKRKGQIADPYRGFHVIVPPQYRSLGCLPAEQFVPELMDHLGVPYYAGLLSAAAYAGAAHHAPMVFQVVVPKARRGITCGGSRVQFIARHDMESTSVIERNTPAGVLRVASPEATALEIVGYPRHCGYLDNVATVLAELGEVLRGPLLAREAARSPLAWVQRLGYLLCLVDGREELVGPLESIVAGGNAFPVALAPWAPITGMPRDDRWMVAVNVDVEPEL